MSAYLTGLKDAHKILTDVSLRVTAEHKATPANWLGGPSKRHNELLAQSRILRECTNAIFAKWQAAK